MPAVLRAVTGPLDARYVERALELPRGAARRRRLLVVYVHAGTVPGTNVHRGDRLVVEPGAHAAAGRLVVCNEEHRLVLRRVRLDSQGRALLGSTDAEELPFPQDDRRSRVVGVVIAIIRPNRSGPAISGSSGRQIAADSRPWAPVEQDENDALPAQRRLDRASTRVVHGVIDPLPRRALVARLDRDLDAVHTWLERNAAQVASSPRRHRHWLGAVTRLATLRNCIAATATGRVYLAFVGEADRVVAELRRDGAAMGQPLELTFLPPYRRGRAPMASLLRSPISIGRLTLHMPRRHDADAARRLHAARVELSGARAHEHKRRFLAGPSLVACRN